MGNGGVEAECRRSRIDKEGYEEGEKKDGGDGDDDVTSRLLRLQALVRKGNLSFEEEATEMRW